MNSNMKKHHHLFLSSTVALLFILSCIPVPGDEVASTDSSTELTAEQLTDVLKSKRIAVGKLMNERRAAMNEIIKNDSELAGLQDELTAAQEKVAQLQSTLETRLGRHEKIKEFDFLIQQMKNELKQYRQIVRNRLQKDS